MKLKVETWKHKSKRQTVIIREDKNMRAAVMDGEEGNPFTLSPEDARETAELMAMAPALLDSLEAIALAYGSHTEPDEVSEQDRRELDMLMAEAEGLVRQGRGE